MSNFFGTVKSPAANIEAPVYEGYIEPTAEAVMAIATEGVIEGLQLQAALHVADATVTYTAVHESVQDAEAVLESVISDTFGKLKNGLKSLWSKIKAWFKSVSKTFSLMFTKGKDFVKKYKKEIESKPAAGFEYEGYVWDIAGGNGKVKALIKAIDGVLDAKLKEAGNISNKLATDIAAVKAMDASALKDEFDIADIKEDLVKRLGNTLGGNVDDMSEIKKELAKAYRRGEDKVEIKDFGKMSRGALIDLIEKTDKSAKDITDTEKEVDKQFNETLKLLGKLETAIGKSKDTDYTATGKGDDNTGKQAGARARITTLASMVSNITRYAQSLNTTIAGAGVENVKAAASEAESVLKQFLRFKPTKESFGSYDEITPENEGSVLESLMAGIKL